MSSTANIIFIQFLICWNILSLLDVVYIHNDINLKYGGARGEQSTLLGDHVNSDHYSLGRICQLPVGRLKSCTREGGSCTCSEGLHEER
jgi:hypothetical protein